MEKTDKKNYCVILAGGRGQRLWPVSREQRPKQFLDLFGTGRTLLQSTFDRFEKLIPIENILICTCAEFQQLVKEQLPEVPEHNIIVEPIHRNTAPSVAWASMRIHHQTPDANIIVSPSDQLVLNETSFAHSMDVGIGYVSENHVLLAMGVRPTRPEPGYGYRNLSASLPRCLWIAASSIGTRVSSSQVHIICLTPLSMCSHRYLEIYATTLLTIPTKKK